MGGHIRLAQPLGEVAGDPLRQPAGIDEDEGGAMALDQLGEAAIELVPDLMGHDRFQRRGRHLEGEIAAAAVARVDDGAVRPGPALRPGAHQEAGDLLDRLLGGREANPLQLAAAERREPLEGEGQMGAALVRRHGMDLVDDHAAGGRQHLAAGVRAQKDVEGFRRGHQDMGRPAAHARPLARRGVAGAHPGPDLHIRQAAGVPVPRGCPPAAARDCARCRWREPSAARHRRFGSHPSGHPPAPGAAARRWRRERPPASCPSPWGRRSAHGARPGAPAKPRLARRSGPGSCARTRRQVRGESWREGSCGLLAEWTAAP